MSLEDFADKYPADVAVKPAMERIREEKGLRTRSLVGILAKELVSEAGAGLRDITRRLRPDEETIYPDVEWVNDLPSDDQGRFFDHLAAVVFGVSLISVEDTLIERRFDASDWCSRYNQAVSGSPIPRTSVSGSLFEPVSVERWQDMLLLAGKDKTLSVFFRDEGLPVLPESLLEILTKSSQVGRIQHRILPLYEERGRFLVTN